MQHDIILKKWNFDLLTSLSGGWGSAGKISSNHTFCFCKKPIQALLLIPYGSRNGVMKPILAVTAIIVKGRNFDKPKGIVCSS